MLQMIWISADVSVTTGNATDNSTWKVKNATVSEEGIGIECVGMILAKKEFLSLQNPVMIAEISCAQRWVPR